MRIVSIDNVVPGMVVGRIVMGFSSQNLLNAGTVLTDEYIKRLRELHITSIYIVDKNTEDIIIDDVVSDQTRMEAGRLTKEITERIRLGKGVDTQKVKRIVVKLMDDLLANKDLLIKLVDIRSLNDFTYFHSVNVAVLSAITGIRLNYSTAKLHQLIMGALLHDIGKIILTHEESRDVKKHPQYGFDILTQNKNFDVSAQIALQHHERFDGQGYPRSLAGAEIHEFARIVAITNTYDRLTTDCVNRPRIPPHQAVEFLMVNSGYAFDPDLVNVFIQCVALYPEGTVVTLNTGETAIIIKSYFGFPTRPRIRILLDKDGIRLQCPQTIELYKSPTYFIKEVLDKMPND